MRGILYYFSGTGNTKWVADRFSEHMAERGLELVVENMEECTGNDVHEYDFMMVGSPVYAEAPAKIVEEFMARLPKSSKGMPCIVYATQGASKSAAVGIMSASMASKGYDVAQESQFRMPNNYYFAVGKMPTEIKTSEMITNARCQVERVVESFINGERLKNQAGALRMKVGVMSGRMFKRFLPKLSSNFSATENCVKCGLCLRNCPKGNITFENSKVVFHANCVHCMRCIHICPINVIRYKNKKIVQTQKRMVKTLDLK